LRHAQRISDRTSSANARQLAGFVIAGAGSSSAAPPERSKERRLIMVRG
jgi:hypothetical protein